MQFESPMTEITPAEVDALLASGGDGRQDYEPEGLFIAKAENGWTPIDNSAGER